MADLSITKGSFWIRKNDSKIEARICGVAQDHQGVTVVVFEEVKTGDLFAFNIAVFLQNFNTKKDGVE